MASQYDTFDQTLADFVRIVEEELKPFIEGDDATTYDVPGGETRDSAAKAIAAMRLTVDTFVGQAQDDLTAYVLPESRDLDADYTLTSNDQNVVFNCTSAATVTLPTGIPGGTWVTLVQASVDGTVQFVADAGVEASIAAPFQPASRTQFSAITAQRVGTCWIISGDCTDVSSA